MQNLVENEWHINMENAALGSELCGVGADNVGTTAWTHKTNAATPEWHSRKQESGPNHTWSTQTCEANGRHANKRC